MNKVRKLAEDLVNKNPALFTNDFNANKKALDQIILIRNRAMRNQVAGAISVLVRDRTPKGAQAEGSTGESTMEERQQSSDNGASSNETSPSREGSSENSAIQQSAV